MQIFLEIQEPRMTSQNMSWKTRQLKMTKYRERRVMNQRILTTCLPHCSLKRLQICQWYPKILDTEKHTPKAKKRRLGMTGPAFTKSTLSVNVRDVSIELQIPKEQNVVETCTSEGKQVVRKYMCKKCPEMFFKKADTNDI